MLHRLLPLALSVCAVSCLLIPGCQGSGDAPSTSLAPALEQPATIEELPAGPTAMPAFPVDDLPDGAPHIVAAQDNILTGAEAYSQAPAGAEISGTDMLLDSVVNDPTWGVWRWGTFTSGNVPQELTVTVEPGTSEYWLLVSDYKLKRWRVFGPLTDGTYSYTYVVGINHVSPSSGYTYAVLLTEGGNALTVNQLNLVANNDVAPPMAPTGLEIVTTTATSISLSWNANAEPDLDVYRVYSGPSVDFDVNDPLAEFHGEVNSPETTYLADGLDWEQEYHFRITAKDVANNESGPSNTATDTTLSPATEPTNLTVVDVGGTWADLSWDLPEAGTPLGYEIYTGSLAAFEVGDPGVVKRNETLVTTRTWRMTGLAGETEYNCRVRSIYPGGPSPLSNSEKFNTVNNSLPKPSFTVSPQYVKCNEDVLFNPLGTIDDDTPPEELIFTWDYENDGIDDEQTTGPEMVTHVYPQRGPMTAKLTVSDGTPVSITEDFVVNFNYESFVGKPSSSAPGTVIAVDTDPVGSRIAVLLEAGNNTFVQYYNGSTWTRFTASNIPHMAFTDVALSPTGASVLVAQLEGDTQYWAVYNFNGTAWSQVAKVAIAEDGALTSRLDVSANGRLSVAVLEAYYTGSEPVVTHHVLYVWHEKADGTFTATDLALENDNYESFDVQRNDSTSYFLYALNGSFHHWSFTDSSDSNLVVQAYAGDIDLLTSGFDPDDDTHVFWAGATDGSRIYFGDNYGTANAAQFHAVTRVPSALLGVGLLADNQSVFYWSDEDANAVQRVMEYDSVAGGGTESTIDASSGMADGGAGGYLVDGSSTGVYTCADETRDGIVRGRFVVNGSVDRDENVYTPTGDNANILNRHVPLVFSDDTVVILSEQAYATARAATAPEAGSPFSDSFYGNATWCIPYAGCITSVPGEFFVAGYREMISNPILEVNRFTVGTSAGVLEDTFNGTSLPLLQHHPDAGGTVLCYASDSSTDIEVRSWNGSVWSAPTSVYSGAAVIEATALASRGTNEWAVILIDASDNLILIETTGGSWDAPEIISTNPISGPSGVALAYNASDDAAIVLERADVTQGLYLGVIPDGGSVTWTKIFTAWGNDTRYPFVTYQGANPLVLFYLRKSPSRNSRIQVVEYLVDHWAATEIPVQLHGTPVGYAMDSTGKIVIAGYNQSADPRYSSAAVVYP